MMTSDAIGRLLPAYYMTITVLINCIPVIVLAVLMYFAVKKGVSRGITEALDARKAKESGSLSDKRGDPAAKDDQDITPIA